jgi:hypothetical protein
MSHLPERLIAVASFLVVAGIVVAGCRILPAAGGPPAGARPCVAVYPADRCDAMLTAAAERLGLADDDVTAIEIAPDPTPQPDGLIETLGGSRGFGILAHVGGDVREVQICQGIPSGPACLDVPAWTIGSPIPAGYKDLPCPGEPPDGCATPVPSRGADAIAAAEALRIADRVIAIPNVGPQEIRLGTATLPNGVLTVEQAQLVDPWPDHVRLSSAGIRLEVRSLVAGRPPFENIYDHGWYPGTEAVEVFLNFEVRHVDPGATIEIRDVVVG